YVAALLLLIAYLSSFLLFLFTVLSSSVFYTLSLHDALPICFLRALPFTYRNVSAAAGTAIRIIVSGECGGNWNLRRGNTAWALIDRKSTRLNSSHLGISYAVFCLKKKKKKKNKKKNNNIIK